MLLPREELKGKKVLDICCRRRRGVYKLSSLVGDSGEVMGVDWSPSYVEEAKDGMKPRAALHAERAFAQQHGVPRRLPRRSPLQDAGIGSSVYHAIYVKSRHTTLFYDQEQAIREFGRVLKPGGLLILETIFADRPRTDSVVDEARSTSETACRPREPRQGKRRAGLRLRALRRPLSKSSFPGSRPIRGYKAGACRAEGGRETKT